MILNDAAKGLAQQMVFWGQDVRHPSGNLLVKFGLKRAPSTGLTGTSCYGMPWEGGILELHGAVASWTSHDSCQGCIYCREQNRIEIWEKDRPPVPGREHGTSASPEIRWQSFQPLLRWLLAYEAWIKTTAGIGWRQSCWKLIRRLPKGRPWLRPDLAHQWWQLASHSLPPRARSLNRTRPLDVSSGKAASTNSQH